VQKANQVWRDVASSSSI